MADWVLILGGTSAIARATAQALAKRRYNLILAGRDSDELERIASDIAIRHEVSTRCQKLDIHELSGHRHFAQVLLGPEERLAGVVCAIGYLGDQEHAFTDADEAERIIATNYTGPVILINEVAALLSKQQQGFIIGIGSVAGDRGRQSNFIYGSAKGGFNLYLQGLRNRLFRDNVQVLTVKPGFVDTAMTFGMDGMFLVAQPEDIGDGIIRAMEKKKDTIYLPFFWRYIMLIIRSIPEQLFKRLSL
ncbi:MAG: SDR family oxidoreductase [Gammaproteobacteria bacterium]|nr:SDR family oxidoreductase [Gammaproteobacteria bacterium]